MDWFSQGVAACPAKLRGMRAKRPAHARSEVHPAGAAGFGDYPAVSDAVPQQQRWVCFGLPFGQDLAGVPPAHIPVCQMAGWASLAMASQYMDALLMLPLSPHRLGQVCGIHVPERHGNAASATQISR